MSAAVITVIAGLIFCYALLARRVTLVTAPMLSIVAGVIFFYGRWAERAGAPIIAEPSAEPVSRGRSGH